MLLRVARSVLLSIDYGQIGNIALAVLEVVGTTILLIIGVWFIITSTMAIILM